MIKFLNKLIREENGQAITEYILVVTLLAIMLTWMGQGFANAVGGYYEEIREGVGASTSPWGGLLGGNQWP